MKTARDVHVLPYDYKALNTYGITLVVGTSLVLTLVYSH